MILCLPNHSAWGKHQTGHLMGQSRHQLNLALSVAPSLADGLVRVETHMQQDTDAGHLPPFYRPRLQLLSDGDLPLF